MKRIHRNNHANVKLIYLKSIYNTKASAIVHQFETDFSQKIGGGRHFYPQKQPQSNSIALLSSILQDKNLEIDISLENPHQQSQRQTKTQLRTQSFSHNKPNIRHLSSMLSSDNKINSKVLRSKTEGIDKQFGENKIMPINKLKEGAKNISFSFKNRGDFKRDFTNFIQKKQDSQIPKEISTNDTVISTKSRFPKNIKYSKGHLSKKRHHELIKLKQNMSKNESISFYETSKQLSRQKTMSIDNDGSYAKMYRQIKGFPSIMQKFSWSKLNEQQSKYNLN